MTRPQNIFRNIRDAAARIGIECMVAKDAGSPACELSGCKPELDFLREVLVEMETDEHRIKWLHEMDIRMARAGCSGISFKDVIQNVVRADPLKDVAAAESMQRACVRLFGVTNSLENALDDEIRAATAPLRELFK